MLPNSKYSNHTTRVLVVKLRKPRESELSNGPVTVHLVAGSYLQKLIRACGEPLKVTPRHSAPLIGALSQCSCSRASTKNKGSPGCSSPERRLVKHERQTVILATICLFLHENVQGVVFSFSSGKVLGRVFFRFRGPHPSHENV